jgi:hypothetical protein
VTTAGDAAVDRAAAAPTWANGVPEPSDTPGYPYREHDAEPVLVKSRFWYTDPAAPSAFTTAIFRFPVAQAATPPAEREAACADDAELGVEEPPEPAPEAGDDGAAAEDEAEEAVPAGGVEDDPPDEHPATAATAATATAAPLTLNDTDSNMIIRPFL